MPERTRSRISSRSNSATLAKMANARETGRNRTESPAEAAVGRWLVVARACYHRGTMGKRIPAGAKRRECPACHQAFRPMTDALWQHNRRLHEKLSIRHQRAVNKA